MAKSPLFLSTLLKGAVRSGQGERNEANAFPFSISQREAPVEMPGMPCCFLHQQMADGSIPFKFVSQQIAGHIWSSLSAWSEQMGVHILYRWLKTLKKKR